MAVDRRRQMGVWGVEHSTIVHTAQVEVAFRKPQSMGSCKSAGTGVERKDGGANTRRSQEAEKRRLGCLPSRAECQHYAATHFDWHKIALQVRQVLLS